MAQNNLFVGYKSSRAIPYTKAPVHDFLVQATLDSGVDRIDYRARHLVDGRNLRIEGIFIERIEGCFAVDLVDARPPCDPEAEALLRVAVERGCAGIVAITASDIRCEPTYSSGREVWSHRKVHVRTIDRERILDALEYEGPLRLDRLDDVVGTRGESRRLIYALACEGAVELDLAAGLGPDAMVRPGIFRPNVRARAYGR